MNAFGLFLSIFLAYKIIHLYSNNFICLLKNNPYSRYVFLDASEKGVIEFNCKIKTKFEQNYMIYAPFTEKHFAYLKRKFEQIIT